MTTKNINNINNIDMNLRCILRILLYSLSLKITGKSTIKHRERTFPSMLVVVTPRCFFIPSI